MGSLLEIITSTKGGTLTFIDTVYVPVNYLTDLAPITTSAHLYTRIALSRGFMAKGTYPIIDPWNQYIVLAWWKLETRFFSSGSCKWKQEKSN